MKERNRDTRKRENMNDRTQENRNTTQVYDMEAWRQDRTFKAEPGQEITEAVYMEMLNAVPPGKIPAETLIRDGRGCTRGFLAGEAYDTIGGRNVYMAFGANEEGRYFYLGLSEPCTQAEILDNEGWSFERSHGASIANIPDCPKCGARPVEVLGKIGQTFVKCPKCGLSSWGFMSPREAHKDWLEIVNKSRA